MAGIQSMTGYGRSEYSEDDFSLQVEVKSVNHRFMDIRIRFDGAPEGWEQIITRQIKKVFSRGSFFITIRFKPLSVKYLRPQFNRNIAEKYLQDFDELRHYYGDSVVISYTDLLSLPGVSTVENESIEDAYLIEQLEGTLAGALEALHKMRLKEGEAIKLDMRRQLERLAYICEDISKLAEKNVIVHKKRLMDNLTELLSGIDHDQGRLETELAILAERLDINEELVRLGSHISQFQELLDKWEPVGRRLDFFCQEMHREITTLGNKAADAGISNLAVEAKDCIEKLREHAQNVE